MKKRGVAVEQSCKKKKKKISPAKRMVEGLIPPT